MINRPPLGMASRALTARFIKTSGILQLNVFLVQGALDLFALGDIAYRAGHHYAFPGFERAQTDLHRKLRSLFAQAVQLHASAHGARARLREKAAAVRRMYVSKAGRNQNLDLSAEQL